MTDAEALQILQDFAHAKPLRLQRAVLHIESRMLTLADIARLAQEKVDAPEDRNKTVLAHVLESTAAYWRARSAQRSAPISDATSDATPDASPEAKSNDGAG